MWRFLVALGFLLALAGLVIMALGVAIFVSSFGNALIATGAVSLSSGIIIIVLASVLKEMRELRGRLDAMLAAGGAPARTVSFQAEEEMPVIGHAAPGEALDEEEEVEPLPADQPARGFPAPSTFPRPRSFERPGAVAGEGGAQLPEALKRGRVLGRTPEGEAFASRMRPLEPPPAPAAEPYEAEPAPERAAPPPRAFPPPPRPAEPAPAQAPEPSVLKSGIVGGMAYTLYSDGSIQAELPDGTLRFASLQELRDHVARSAQQQR